MGGNDLQVMLYAILPQVLPVILGIVIFEWEINIRRSAVLGLVGAGGWLGQGGLGWCSSGR